MNAFYEQHQDTIRFGYRCFDPILLNGLFQPFQQPERVMGFFNTYRNLYPVSRQVLRDIAEQFQGWVKNRPQKWDVPILDAPPGRQDEFVEPYFRRAKPGEVVVILRAREPARIMIAIGNPKDNRWHLQFAPAILNRERADALLAVPNRLNLEQKQLIVDFAMEKRLPTLFGERLFVAAGGLMSYGTDFSDLLKRVAIYVDRILRGAKPADLPIELADEVRARHQPQNRQGARPHDPAIPSRAGRPGDRMSGLSRKKVADHRETSPPHERLAVQRAPALAVPEHHPNDRGSRPRAPSGPLPRGRPPAAALRRPGHR
jgi:hypothetical protein